MSIERVCRWEIQRLIYGRWMRTGYNVYEELGGLEILDEAKKRQPSLSFRLIRITEVITTEVIASDQPKGENS